MSDLLYIDDMVGGKPFYVACPTSEAYYIRLIYDRNIEYHKQLVERGLCYNSSAAAVERSKQMIKN